VRQTPAYADRRGSTFSRTRSRPPERDFPAAGSADAGECLQKFRLPIAGDTRDADDFTGPKFEAHGFHPWHVQPVPHFQILNAEQRRARLRRAFSHLQQHRAPDHFLGQTAWRGLGGDDLAHHRTLPHHRHAVGDRHDFAKLVGHQDDRLSLLAQSAQRFEKLIGFLRRKHRGRLVQNQNLGASIKRFENLHPLLESHRQLPTPPVSSRHLETVIASQPLQLGPRRRQPARQEPATLHAEDDVFQHGEILHAA